MIGDTLIRISQAAVIIRLHPMEWGGNILGKGIDVPFPCDSGGLDQDGFYLLIQQIFI